MQPRSSQGRKLFLDEDLIGRAAAIGVDHEATLGPFGPEGASSSPPSSVCRDTCTRTCLWSRIVLSGHFILAQLLMTWSQNQRERWGRKSGYPVSGDEWDTESHPPSHIINSITNGLTLSKPIMFHAPCFMFLVSCFQLGRVLQVLRDH